MPAQASRSFERAYGRHRLCPPGLPGDREKPGLKREAKLILLYYVPHEPLSRWIPPWAPKQKQSSLAPGFSWSLFKTGVKIDTKRTGVQAGPHS